MENKVLYMPQRLFPWSAIKLNGYESFFLSQEPDMGTFFIPIFESEQKCKEAFPDCDVIPVKTSVKIDNQLLDNQGQ